MLKISQHTRAFGCLSKLSLSHPVASAGIRTMASQPAPQARAQSIINALPGHSALSKSGILATGFAGVTFAISNSLYVVNAETCLLAVFAALMVVASKTVAPGYKAWAEGHIEHITKTLNAAREDHVAAVQDRIDSVNKLAEVVPITKALFAVSKETVELEAKAFELKQKVDVAARAKEVLDSWVRYEASVRQREQEDLTKAVISKVEKTLQDRKVQDQILKEALADIEKVFKSA